MRLSKKNKISIINSLDEDKANLDLTSKMVVREDFIVKAHISSKDKGIICGINVAKFIFKHLDKKAKFKVYKEDSQRIKKEERVLSITANVRAILSGERTALNYLSLLSAVATKTSQYIQKTKGIQVKILDTRKTLPLLRDFQKYAVKAGGGFNHRGSLAEGILIKDNHLKVSIPSGKRKTDLKAIGRVFKKIRNKSKFPLAIEVEALNEFHMVAGLNPDIILLDNFSLKNLKKAVIFRNSRFPHILLEASGGITISNIRKVALTGVDRISVGALTHTIDSIDLSLNIA